MISSKKFGSENKEGELRVREIPAEFESAVFM